MRYLTDLLLIFILFVFGVIFSIYIPPVDQGFFCDDDSIRYPYIKQETIPLWLSIVLTLLTCSLSFIAIEYANSKRFLSNCIVEFIPFLFGYCLSLSIVGYCKCLVGRLRPNFLEYCKPDMSQCIDPGTNKTLRGVHIATIICKNLGQNGFAAINGRSSFPSGHAAIAVYSLVYLSIYIHHKMPNLPVLFRSMIQLSLINLALFVGYSRVYDYLHHKSDVFAGITFGTITVIFTMVIIRPRYTPLLDLTAEWQTIPEGQKSRI